MNQIQYRKAAIELGKIPGMEMSPWHLIDHFQGGGVRPKLKPERGWGKPVGPWLLIDDFSDWSAAKIASNVWRNLPFKSRKKAEELALTGGDPFDTNLELVQFIIKAHKINPQSVVDSLPKD